MKHKYSHTPESNREYMKYIIPHLLSYFKNTTVANKLIDATISLFCILGTSMALGYISFHWSIMIAPLFISAVGWGIHRYKQTMHTVENTLNQTSQIDRILNAEQYVNDFAFIGHFRFSNGATTLDQGFNFMKMHLTEYALPDGMNIFPQRWQDLPVVINLPLMAAISEGIAYSSQVSETSAMFTELRRAGIKSYTVVPIYGSRRSLIGFLYVGSKTTTPPDETICTQIVDKIELV